MPPVFGIQLLRLEVFSSGGLHHIARQHRFDLVYMFRQPWRPRVGVFPVDPRDLLPQERELFRQATHLRFFFAYYTKQNLRARLFFATLFMALLAAHLCHAHVLWAEEALPLAAAREILFGKTLYKSIWFDKPPLVPLVYLLWFARTGFVLRFFGAVYCFTCCIVAWLFARAAWGRREAFWAAGLLGFVLTFDIPSSVLPLAADLLLLLPHLAAVYLAFTKRPFWSGVCAGIAFLTNVKGVFVLLSCALFAWPSLLPLTVGFVSPLLLAAIILGATGAWPAYLDQVWIWPSIYAGSSPLANPVANAAARTLNWIGFHVALCLAALYAQPTQRKKWLAWLALSFVAVALGMRFFPRYFFQLLPVLVLLAARGFAKMPQKPRWAVLALFLIPLIRFGPRYPILALNLQPGWSDLAMDIDSQAASEEIKQAAPPNATLYVWGYRPEIFVYTGLHAASRYLDSQAMTGVPADRHLGQSTPVALPSTAAARRELTESKPDILADGLSLYNPKLAMQAYPDLRGWLSQYQEFGRTRTTILYRRR